ncbi:MAG: hypothetical protein HW380_1756 [Magnetococcales bacterium]|nr:hypothetical protein [Magnetococcales bacterium]HIJ85670.1 hypothetical protein [Magnetococcales bacterium]
MDENPSSQADRNFRFQTPSTAFEAYCERERRRLEAMDTAFNADLFEKARSLVLTRLGSGEKLP